MKKLLVAVCLMFGGATFVSAQVDQTTPSQTPAQTQDQDQQQISVSELPDQITAKLEGQDYAGWTVGSAHKKMDESNQEIFVVELRQGTETKKVKFDKDGNEIEKGDKGDNSNYREESSPSDQSTLPEQSTTDQSATDQSAESTDQADNSSTPAEQP